MKQILSPLLALVLIIAGASLLHGASVILDDTFSSASGTPAAMGYHTSSNDAGLTFTDPDASDNTMRFAVVNNTGNQGVFKQFPTVNLSDGETLRLSLKITALSVAAIVNQLQIALVHSPVTYTSNQAVEIWSYTSGYAFYFDTGSGNTGVNVRSKSSEATARSIFYSSLRGTGSGTLLDGNSYSLTLEIERVDSATSLLKADIDGVSVFTSPIEHTGTPYVSFNTIAIGLRVGSNMTVRSLEFEQVLLSVVAVPEPDMRMMGVLGIAGMVLTRALRDRRSRQLLFQSSANRNETSSASCKN
ncbi:MAG TPA: hypothetical protein VNQ90_05110 [Chthoniobacteraceae bacterium]|nr:hypothetical protein [Chthoniobacteraceae bacterium]